MKTNIQENLSRSLSTWGDKPAVVAKDGTVSYQMLERYSANIAQSIRQRLSVTDPSGLRNICIGVCMERNKTLVPAILAIFRLGATYLPIDPSLPDNRKRYMAENADMVLLLTDSSNEVGGIPSVRQLYLNGEQLSEPVVGDYTEVLPDDCAYIIYTSGTTGNPKGVRISYRNLDTFTRNLIDKKLYHLSDPANRYLAFASISFDASILELMMCIPAGGTLILAGEDERRDISLLDELIRREKVNIAFFPPSLLGMFADLDFPSFKTLLFGAEAIGEKLFNRLKQQPYRLMNVYGPTENTVLSTIRIVGKDTSYDDIGYPLKGTVCYVLSENLQQTTLGATGELCLGGPQVSLGYIGSVQLNEKSFISYDGERLYRTGDLVQQQPDGSIRFIGRKDTQVKIRGFRIELTEIAERLNRDPDVERAHVVVVERNGRQLLGAYLQPSVSGNFHPEEVKERLRAELPYYMIPNLWQVVDHFQRTINDKIDVRALPAFTSLELKYVPPVHPGEVILCGILKEMLGLPQVSVEADLIDDLGLTSLDMLRLVTEANKKGCPINVSAVYTARNLRRLLLVPRQEPIYWYRQQNLKKPVIILVCGSAYFNHLYFNLADRLYPKYDFLVVDAIYDHFNKVATDIPELLEYYVRTVQPMIRERTVYALTGFCTGAELAVGLAEMLHRSMGIMPKVFALDGQAWQNPALCQNYPLLVFPGDTDEMVRERNEIINIYFRTTPNLIYQGEVIVLLSGLFHQQAGLSPEESWTEESYRIFRTEYDNCERLWNKYYPNAPVLRLPTDHWHFLEGESLEQLITVFLK